MKVKKKKNNAGILTPIILLVCLIAAIWISDGVIRKFSKDKYFANTESYILSKSSAAGTTDDSSQSTETTNQETTVDSAVETQATIDESIYDIVNVSADDMYKGPLVLVNAEHSYKYADDSSSLASFTGKNDCYRLKSFELLIGNGLLEPLNSMFADFNAASSLKNILIMSTYRTTAEQTALNSDTSQSSYSIGGGYSENHTGYAMDLRILNDDGTNSSFTGTDSYSWIAENCYKYGFILRYTSDKESVTGIAGDAAHFRYIGIPHSIIMKENNLCLEEYTEFIKAYKYDSPYISQNGGTTYNVFYVVKDSVSDTTKIPVPKGKTYIISGNNVNGYVVTITE